MSSCNIRFFFFFLTDEEERHGAILSEHCHKHAQTTFAFLIYTSKQSTLPRDIRTGKISLA